MNLTYFFCNSIGGINTLISCNSWAFIFACPTIALHIPYNVSFPYLEFNIADRYSGNAFSFIRTLIIYPAITIGSSKSKTHVFPTNSLLLVLLKSTSPFLTIHFSISLSGISIYFKLLTSKKPLYVILFILKYLYLPPSTAGLLVPYLTSETISLIVPSGHFIGLVPGSPNIS